MSDSVPTSLRPERPSAPSTRSRSQASHRGHACRCAPVFFDVWADKPSQAHRMPGKLCQAGGARWQDTGRQQRPSAVSERVGHLPSVTPPRTSVPKFAASPTLRVRAAAAPRAGGGAEKLRHLKCAKWPLRALSRRSFALAVETGVSVVCCGQHPTIHLVYRISASALAIIPASESGAQPAEGHA